MSPESPESPETVSGLGREQESGKSGISIDTGLRTSPENRPVRILLGETASKALLDAGTNFIVAARQTYPDDPSRVVLHLVATTFERGNDAVRVAMGEKPLSRIKSSTKTKL